MIGYQFIRLPAYLPLSIARKNMMRYASSPSLLLSNRLALKSSSEKQFCQTMHFTSSPDNIVTITEVSKGIKHVQLNRPEKLNSLDMRMFESIASAASELRDDTSVRAVILSGAGKAFCTGLDVKSIVSPLKGNPKSNIDRLLKRPSGYGHPPPDNDSITSDVNTSSKASSIPPSLGNLAQDVAYLWRDIPAPVIAVLHGMCFGGGMQIALGADLRFAEPNCKLSIMEAKWGLIPDMSASITLRELVRIDIAKELTMTGRVITAEEGARLGLITRCTEDPMAEAVKVAKEIVSRSPDAVAESKRLFQQSWVATQKDCLELESKIQSGLIGSWNQAAASGKNFSLNIPYAKRKDS
mmetsp:Transcript_3283/g.3660  ORF Transcript_3283/g.3660 Transcript_3283/m.3660 type:complete len:354 (-) Transcript_3283:502-1563(-)